MQGSSPCECMTTHSIIHFLHPPLPQSNQGAPAAGLCMAELVTEVKSFWSFIYTMDEWINRMYWLNSYIIISFTHLSSHPQQQQKKKGQGHQRKHWCLQPFAFLHGQDTAGQEDVGQRGGGAMVGGSVGNNNGGVGGTTYCWDMKIKKNEKCNFTLGNIFLWFVAVCWVC